MKVNNVLFIVLLSFIINIKPMDVEGIESSLQSYDQDYKFFVENFNYQNYKSSNSLEDLLEEIIKIKSSKERNVFIQRELGVIDYPESLYNKLLSFIWYKEFGITSNSWEDRPDLEDTVKLVMLHRKMRTTTN